MRLSTVTNGRTGSVRSAARGRLFGLYSRHFALAVPAPGVDASPPPSLVLVPPMLPQCYGADARDLDARLEVETLLATKLRPAAAELRLPALGAVHRALNADQRSALRALMRPRQASFALRH